MAVLRLVLADQLSESLSALRGLDKTHDTVMLCEVMEEATYVPHHPRPISRLTRFRRISPFFKCLDA